MGFCASIRAFRCSSYPEEPSDSAFFASLPKFALLFPEAALKRRAGVQGMSLQICCASCLPGGIVHENNQNSLLFLEAEHSQQLPALISPPPPRYCHYAAAPGVAPQASLPQGDRSFQFYAMGSCITPLHPYLF